MKARVAKDLCGFLNLHKPSGMTSRTALDYVSRPLRGLKVGHAGTLDPLASGVLVVALGSATRLISYAQGASKTYHSVIRLGATSDTLDGDGVVTESVDFEVPTAEQVESAVLEQVGLIQQIPPQYSALWVNGKRAYDLARAGHEVELAAREVEVKRITIVAYEWPRLTIEVDCGGGTYIRSIARDIGDRLGCGGLIEVLIRTRIGSFTLEDSIDPVGFDPSTLDQHLIKPLKAVEGLPRFDLDARQRDDLLLGRPLLGTPLTVPGEYVLVGPDGEMVALGEFTPDSKLWPRKVVAKP